MQPTAKYSFKVYADHVQFFIEDEILIEKFWEEGAEYSEGSFDEKIETGIGIIEIITSSYDDVPVEIEIYETEPALEYFADWQHVAEASLETASGAIHAVELFNKPTEEFRIPLTAGIYRVRIYYYGVEDTDPKEYGEEYYKIQIWPAEYAPLKILKQYRPENRLIRCGLSEENARLLLKDLEGKYTGNGRYYHTYFHILKVLLFVDRLKQGAKNFAAVQLAAYYHDVIYDTHSKDNEEQSAEYDAKVLGEAGVATETIAEVKRLILATKTHKADPADTDCQILLDADLAVLGIDPELYDIYSDEIRQEYHWVAEADYRAGRKSVLENFLKRDRIYYTDYMYQKYEALARENITREINILS